MKARTTKLLHISADGSQSHNTQTQLLTYSVRLPDEAQEDALRLLDASRAVANQTISILWPHLWPQVEEFGLKSKGPALKQLGK